MDLSPLLPEFSVWVDVAPGLSDSEYEAQMKTVFETQRAIDGLLSGSIPLDTAEAMMAENGWDPYRHWETVEDNLLFVVGA